LSTSLHLITHQTEACKRINKQVALVENQFEF
jgi:hypothetical protein